MTFQQLLPLALTGLALLLILRRNSRKRVLKPHLLWVVPTLVVPLILFGIWGSAQNPNIDHSPFGPGAWAMLVIGLVLGGVAGWFRGKTMTIEKDPGGTLYSRASPVGLLLLVALFAVRRAAAPMIESNAGALHLNVLAVTDAFLLFAIGMIIVQRVEMFIRARRIQAGGSDAHVAMSPGT